MVFSTCVNNFTLIPATMKCYNSIGLVGDFKRFWLVKPCAANMKNTVFAFFNPSMPSRATMGINPPVLSRVERKIRMSGSSSTTRILGLLLFATNGFPFVCDVTRTSHGLSFARAFAADDTSCMPCNLQL